MQSESRRRIAARFKALVSSGLPQQDALMKVLMEEFGTSS